jgi:hypothetical protein
VIVDKNNIYSKPDPAWENDHPNALTVRFEIHHCPVCGSVDFSVACKPGGQQFRFYCRTCGVESFTTLLPVDRPEMVAYRLAVSAAGLQCLSQPTGSPEWNGNSRKDVPSTEELVEALRELEKVQRQVVDTGYYQVAKQEPLPFEITSTNNTDAVWHDLMSLAEDEPRDFGYEDVLDEVIAIVRARLIEKHKKYGSKNLFRRGEEGLIIRVEDKLARVENRLEAWDEGYFDEDDEDDDWLDIAGYGLQGMLYRRGKLDVPVSEGG